MSAREQHERLEQMAMFRWARTWERWASCQHQTRKDLIARSLRAAETELNQLVTSRPR